MTPEEFVAAQTVISRAPLVPEIALHLASEITPIWQATEAWLAELDTMRARMRSVRDALAKAGTAGRIDLTPLGTQNGLFSMLPVTKEEGAALREDHGIYMAASGRINIAGLTRDNLPKFIAALAAVAG